MGLDPLELVMLAEDEFGILLADDQVGGIRTAGELHRYVVELLRQRDTDPCRSARVFHRLRRAIVDRMGVAPRAVRPSSRIEELIPRGYRRAIWKRMREEGEAGIPSLRYPSWLSGGFCGLVAAAPLVALVPILFWKWPLASLPGTCIAQFLVVIALAVLTRPLAVCAPSGCVTLADAVRRAAPRPYRSPESTGRAWTEEDVWNKLQEIIARVLGVEREKITKDSNLW